MTDEQKLRAREKRLLKTYGISLAQYEEILKAQNGCCAICGRPATDFSVNLSVDHFHFRIGVSRCTPTSTYFGLANEDKISKRYASGWIAVANIPNDILPWRWAKTKAAVIALAKEDAKRHSVRGLLCPGRHGPAGTCCNRNLGRVDNVEWLRKALNYLENPPARKILDLP